MDNDADYDDELDDLDERVYDIDDEFDNEYADYE